jgi:predicted RNase H-like nuclease
MNDVRVLGVDACKAGWVGIAIDDGQVSPYFATHITDLIGQAERDGPIEVVAVDMPIGLADSSIREADILAREVVGPRWRSVFFTPVRTAIEIDDYRTAAEKNYEIIGKRISQQAYRLRTKLLQVDQWVRETGRRVVEAHPEVCFAHLAGGPLSVRKSTWAGAARRRKLLADVGIELSGELGAAGENAAVDDVLDAAAVAWTARRVARNEALRMPDPPETFSDGIECAIWV